MISQTEANKRWKRMTRKQRLQALEETGSFPSDADNDSLYDIGGSTADVLQDWINEHKLAGNKERTDETKKVLKIFKSTFTPRARRLIIAHYEDLFCKRMIK